MDSGFNFSPDRAIFFRVIFSALAPFDTYFLVVGLS